MVFIRKNQSGVSHSKVIVHKGRPKFLKISKGRKSETAMTPKNKAKKYPVDATY